MMSKSRKNDGGKVGVGGSEYRHSGAKLDELIAEATVDAYGDSEQSVGLFTMMEDNLAFPFDTEVLGMRVKMVRLDMTDADEIVAICHRGRTRQATPILNPSRFRSLLLIR